MYSIDDRAGRVASKEVSIKRVRVNPWEQA